MAFPTNLTNAVDSVTEIMADHLNNLEAKVGIDGSAVATSLDYLLKNSASLDPGHQHSSASAGLGNVTNDAQLKASQLDTDGTLAADADDRVASQKATKTYADVIAAALASGWVAAGETWTYASADAPTFTFTISGDKTGKYSPGMRLRLTQGGSVKFFIVTVVAYSSPNTTITVYGGTDYTLANATITDPYFSPFKAPQGFPLDPAKWTVEVTNNSSIDQNNPTINIWYNLGNINISVPIGAWRLEYSGYMEAGHSGTSYIQIFATLSTSVSSESENKFRTAVLEGASNTTSAGGSVLKSKTVNVSGKTTYYLLFRAYQSGLIYLRIGGAMQITIIRAVCAYL
jgi:hypothetical protein